MSVLLSLDWQLSQGVGYAVILGFGAFFSIVMSLLAHWARRYMGESNSAEFFNTAGRSLKTGLTAAAVVSAWTWSATLLQSSTVAYAYGVSGPYWYGAGACVQIILFSILAIMLKRRAPAARTFAEIMRVRYGLFTHKVYTFVSILTNTVIMITLLLGGAATAAALTGMDVYAAIWLTPIGVVFYTMAGGLKATFLTDYSHAVIIFAMIVGYMFATYATSPVIGSAGRMYELLDEASKRHPVEGNAGGSYLTMKSKQGSTFGVIQIITCFGVSFADQAIWQRAVAARAEATVVSYIIGGAAWFAIPFGLATTLGLAAIALETDPSWPTYPNRMTSAEVSGGLVAPFAAAALGGTGGSVAILIMIYMAITSCMSAELVAVTSVCEYDIYRQYINPSATDQQQKKFGRWSLIVYTLLLSALCSVLHVKGIDLGFVYMIMGIITGPAVGPLVMALLWKGQNKWGANLAIILGLPAGIAAWLGYTADIEGDVNDKAKLMDNYPSLAGNLTALLGGIGISVFFSLLKLDNFDWEILKSGIPTTEDVSISPEQDKKMRWATKLAASTAIAITVCFLILFPIPLSETNYIFSKGFFGFWVGLAIAWALVDCIVILLFPIWESRGEIAVTARGIWIDFVTGFKLDTPTIQDRLGYVSSLEKEIAAGKLAESKHTNEGVPLAFQHGDKTSNTTPSVSKNEEEKTQADVPLADIQTFSSQTNLHDIDVQTTNRHASVASVAGSENEYGAVKFHA